MPVDRAGAGLFALGLGARAAAAGGLAFGLFELVLRTQLYATALLVAAAAALVVADIGREIGRADSMLERFMEGLAADAYERPARPPPGFGRMARAMDLAIARLAARRGERERRIDHLQGLADTVSAALLVLKADGSVELANRAARRLAGQPVSRLDEIAGLDAGAAATVASLRPGGRAVTRLKDGASVLVLAADFSIPGGERRRLVSLQGVTGELDVVEHKAWRDLANILAHEMMNSLTPIVSLSESVPALLAAGRAAEAAEASEVIARRATGLMAFVDSYRRFAELPPPKIESFPLAGLVADVDRLMGAALKERGVAWTSGAPSGLTLRADRHLVEQAAINLVKNAADAALGGEAPRVELACAVEEGMVVLSVADNGRGVAAEDVERIFVPFFTTRADGSGVGLSLARQIALAHGGTLEVRSNTPKGAVFRLALPV